MTFNSDMEAAESVRGPKNPLRRTLILTMCSLPLLCYAAKKQAAGDDQNGQILIIMADRDFYDPEYTIPRAVLEKRGYSLIVANPSSGISVGTEGLEVQADMAIRDARAENYISIILVGGFGVQALYDNPALIDLVLKFHRSGKVIAAQCYAPVIFAQAGLLKGRKAACWDFAKNKIETYGVKYSEEVIEVSDNILTAKAGSERNVITFMDAYVNMLEARKLVVNE